MAGWLDFGRWVGEQLAGKAVEAEKLALIATDRRLSFVVALSCFSMRTISEL